MTLEQISIFVAVGEREHLTRAAEALGLTPSAVSAAIKTLENQHNVHLFDRVGRGIALTREGRAFLDQARALLAQAQSACHLLRDLGGMGSGVLDVHASQTIASYWLPARLMRFHEAHPDIEIRLHVGNTRQVADAVREGRAEIGFAEGAVDDTSLNVTNMSEDQLVVVVRADHPLSRRRRPNARDIVSNAAWIMREPGSGTRSEFEEGLRRLGCAPDDLRVALTLPSNEAILSAVREGGCAAAISKSVATPFLDNGDLVALDIDLPVRAFRIVRHSERHVSPAARAFFALCANIAS